MHVAILATLAAAALGWADDIAVTPSRGGPVNAPWLASLSGVDRPGERTLETLKRYDLESRYRRDPAGVLLHLEKFARRAPEPDLVFALAELSWVEAQRLNRKRRPEAIDFYLDAAAYAFDYLFDPDLAPGRQPSDPRFRLAMDLYNGGLDQIIRAARSRGNRIQPGETLSIEQSGHTLAFRVSLEQSPWKPADIQELLMCSDFQVSGLPTRTYQYGLGVPLIGVRRAAGTGTTKPEDNAPSTNPLERFFPAETAFPLTAFLRPNSRLKDPGADVATARQCTLYLIDPVERRSVVQGDHTLAIEADLTTPLAYMWSKADLSSLRWSGFLRPGTATERTGLTLLRPYEPGKIPVVMVHGLMSSPLVWIPMVNELLRDPEIQRNYQFLLYGYPTGVPIPIAASYLRDALRDAQMQLDPNGTDPAFRRMVLLGHSMGGLLSHAMAVDSQDHFWAVNSYRRFDDLIGPPEVLREIRHYTFFEALPFVDRVVFLATPHRGSDYASGMIGRIGSSLISTPDQYTALLTQLVKDNPDAFNSRRFRRLPTSIETLEVDAPVLLALLAMKPRDGVSFHSVIAAKYPGPLATTTDGVVPYRSTHFEGAASELVVNSDHGVVRDPEAILEIRRILGEHLQATGLASRAAPFRIDAALDRTTGGAVPPTLTAPLEPVDTPAP